MSEASPEIAVEPTVVRPVTKTLKQAVSDHFSGGEWSLAFEVGNATGAGVSRHADAIAMNMWPSRGLSIHGIEMKISRGDWQREPAKPQKAEEIHQYCDYWWLAATRGVVKDIEEIPPGWGFLEMRENGSLAIKRQAVRQDRPSEIKRSFVAGILRARDRSENEEFRAAVAVASNRAVDHAIESERLRQSQYRSDSSKTLEKLQAALGDQNLRYLGDETICRAVAFVLKVGATETYSGILGLIDKFASAENSARYAVDALREAADKLGIELPKPPTQITLPLRRRA